MDIFRFFLAQVKKNFIGQKWLPFGQISITQLSWVDVPTSLPVLVQKVDFQIQIVKPPLPTPPPPPLPILERVPHTGSQEVFTSKTQLTDLDSTDTRGKD